MTNALLIIVMIGGPLCLYVVVLTLPRWFARSLHGHRMWRLRDALVDDVLGGKLPRDNEAVKQLVVLIDGAVHDRHTSLLDVYIVGWACRSADPEFLRRYDKAGLSCPLDGLTVAQQQEVMRYREQFKLLYAGSMLLGSWFGIAHILPFVPAGVAAAMQQAGAATREGLMQSVQGFKRAFRRGISTPAREATDLAAMRSRAGQEAAAFAVRSEASRFTGHEHRGSARHLVSHR
jgi:hypothetical protein